ncbi:hypothetical protein Tco_0424480 [Tanacetum coccineum]
MHRTKDEFAAVFKKMVNFMPGAQERLVEASLLVARTDYAFLNKISEYASEPLSVILQLEPEKLVRLANVPFPRDTCVSPPVANNSTVMHVSKSLELSTNVAFIPSNVASEQSEEMVNAEVDESDPKITDDTITAKSGHAFMQGMSVVLDDAVELVGVGSGCVFSSPSDVVVALSTGEECDGLAPSSIVGEEAVVDPPRVLGEGRVVCQRTLVTPRLGQTDCGCVAVNLADPESCHPP